MRVLGLAGWSGAGKTTLLAKLVPELARRGVSVSTLKHAHHAFEIDRPGKDSFAHREAGAREVLIASGTRWAHIRELRGEPEPSLADHLRRLSPVDLVLVEGFKAWGHPKLEVHRAANAKPFLWGEVPNVRALATDAVVPSEAPLPAAHLDDVVGIADLVLRWADPLDDVVRRLEAAPAPQRLRAPRDGVP